MIAVDWGTSSLRAYRLDASGAVRGQRSAAVGLLACDGRFEAVLSQQLEGWDDATIVMAGMIGSRSGWREVPYLACPVGIDEMATGLCGVDAPMLAGRQVFIAPGVSHRPADGSLEVMRGEETQLLGLVDRLPGDGAHHLCLPGTHSKWVQVQGGRIVALRTAMTGELYAVLRRYSLLAALMPAAREGAADSDVDDQEAFARGIVASARDGGLTNHLFGVRTQGLFGTLSALQAPSYLSGLLIGHELRGLLPAARTTVHLIGAEALLQRYVRALALLGIASETHSEALTARGLLRLAQACGLPI